MTFHPLTLFDREAMLGSRCSIGSALASLGFAAWLVQEQYLSLALA